MKTAVFRDESKPIFRYGVAVAGADLTPVTHPIASHHSAKGPATNCKFSVNGE
jgi:hypothetical protein